MCVEPPALLTIDIPPRNTSRSLGDPQIAQIVLLHGWGANYRDLLPLAQALGNPGIHYWFPNAPFPHPQVPDGRSWFDLEGLQGVEESSARLQTWLLGLEQQSGIALERTVLAGFSQGGAMTLRVGLGLQPQLAGLMCLSGFWVGGPDAADPDRPFPPVLMVHGSHDPVVSLAYARQTQKRLETLNVDLQFHKLNAMHEIPAPAIGLMKDFLRELS